MVCLHACRPAVQKWYIDSSRDLFFSPVHSHSFNHTFTSDVTRIIPFMSHDTVFSVFYTEQGNQGILGKASKQQLDTVFGTSKEDEAIKKLIELGTPKPGDAIPKGYGGHNDSQYVDASFSFLSQTVGCGVMMTDTMHLFIGVRKREWVAVAHGDLCDQ